MQTPYHFNSNPPIAFLYLCFLDILISEVENMMDSEEDSTDSGTMNVDPLSDLPPVKCLHLLSHYKVHKKCSSAQDSSIVTQIRKYFDAIHDSDTDNAFLFWAKNHDRFPQLHNLALKVLSEPASSAPVERVFGRGSIIIRPYCTCLGHRMLKSLMSLKWKQTTLKSFPIDVIFEAVFLWCNYFSSLLVNLKSVLPLQTLMWSFLNCCQWKTFVILWLQHLQLAKEFTGLI